MQKPNAIAEMKDLAMSGQIILTELVQVKWTVWDKEKGQPENGILEKGIYKKWIDKKLVEIPTPKNATILKVFNSKLNPGQEINHYDRFTKTKKLGKVFEVELSIKDIDFVKIVAAMAEKAAIDGVMSVKLENFSFSYEMEYKKMRNGNTYKALKSVVPIAIKNGMSLKYKPSEEKDIPMF